MTDDQAAILETFLAGKSMPSDVEDLDESEIDLAFDDKTEGSVCRIPDTDNIAFFATVGEYPTGDPESDLFPFQYNFFMGAARGDYCAIDADGDTILLCHPVHPADFTAEGLEEAWAAVIESVREIRFGIAEDADGAEGAESEATDKEEVIVTV